MAKSRLIGPPRMWPFWPRQFNPTAAPSLQNGAYTLDEQGDRATLVGQLLWADGAAHVPAIIHWRTANASSPVLTARVGLRAVDLVNGPPGRLSLIHI